MLLNKPLCKLQLYSAFYIKAIIRDFFMTDLQILFSLGLGFSKAIQMAQEI